MESTLKRLLRTWRKPKVVGMKISIIDFQKVIMCLFLGLFKFGKNWKEIQNQVSTRSCSQVRSHAQKYFIKLQKIIKDRKKQKNKQDIELTDIEKEILQNFTLNDVTPNSPEVLISLLQNSCLVPISKTIEKNNVTGD